MEELLTAKHVKLIQKKITETIENEIDFSSLVRNAIEREFDSLWDGNDIGSFIYNQVTEVIKEHLVKAGLLKGEGND